MTAVSGLGPWPGAEPLEAQSVVLGDLADVPDGVEGRPFLPRLANRGPGADSTGRGVALLVDLPGELGPHGWRLADRPGGDLARARALLREDVDALAVAAHGYAGPLVLPVPGPWSLAASLYLARGDRALADAGAVAELTASLTAGLAEHLAAVRVAVPGAEPEVLLHEPTLAAVLAGAVPTFSGSAAIRRVAAGIAVDGLRSVVDGLRAAGATRVTVHVGASTVAVRPAAGSGADAVGIEVAGVDERGWEVLAETVEGGTHLWAALPAAESSQCAGPDVAGTTAVLTGPWQRVGLPAAGLADVVLVPATRLDRLTPDDARGALRDVVRVAEAVGEVAAG